MSEHAVAGIRFTFSNWDLIVSGIMAALALAEIIVRLTPTKTDDGFVERVGKIIHRLFDKARVPNVTHQSKLEGKVEITDEDLKAFDRSLERKVDETLKK